MAKRTPQVLIGLKAASSAQGAKAKDLEYNKNKAKTQQQKAQELAAVKATSLNIKNPGKDSKAACWGCGKALATIRGSFATHHKG